MKIMYTLQDGTLAIIHGAPKADLERTVGKALTNNEYKALVWGTVPVDAINPREITDAAMPASREFRGAWRDLTPEAVVDIDLNEAKKVKLAQIRAERKELLEKADIAVAAALDADDTAALKAAKLHRQKLRDVTNALKAAEIQTIEELAGKTIADYLIV